jgi:hypothetical protein
MFKKNKEVELSTLEKAKREAIKNDDMETLDLLTQMESEQNTKEFKKWLGGYAAGFGSVVVGVGIGLALSVYTSKQKQD